MKRGKKAVSPIVATVLLIALVVIIAIIIFFWARGFVKESVTKTVSGTSINAEQACDQIQISVKNHIGGIQIINQGNVPIYGFDIKTISSGSSYIENLRDKNLAKGNSYIHNVENYDSLEVIPVILGQMNGEKNAYVCKNSFIAE